MKVVNINKANKWEQNEERMQCNFNKNETVDVTGLLLVVEEMNLQIDAFFGSRTKQ